jgi:excisionase family DNA binding protein
VKTPGGKPVQIGDWLLTLVEAAQILCLHPRTVLGYVRRGELQGRLIGRRWRFRRRDLDAFFDSARSQWDFVAAGKDDAEE